MNCFDRATGSAYLCRRQVLHCEVYVKAQMRMSGRVWTASSQMSGSLPISVPDKETGQIGLSLSLSSLFVGPRAVGSSHQLSQWS